MAPAKQMKVMQEFQKQSAQMDMTVRYGSDFQYKSQIKNNHFIACIICHEALLPQMEAFYGSLLSPLHFNYHFHDDK